MAETRLPRERQPDQVPMQKKKKFWEEEREVTKAVVVWVKFAPSEVVALDKLIRVYGPKSRALFVKKIVNWLLAMDDDKQRAMLIADELFTKKAEALLAKQKAEKELERIEADIKRIGCEEKP